MTRMAQALSRAAELGRIAGIRAAENKHDELRPEAPTLTTGRRVNRHESELTDAIVAIYPTVRDAQMDQIYEAWTDAAERGFDYERARMAAWVEPDDVEPDDDRCQCGTVTGEYCGATGDRWVDYCPAENAGTAAAAGSWAGLTVYLLVSTACAETLRTLYDDDGDATLYANAYAYASARDGR